MPFQPFQSEFADHRVVVIPADLDDERRTRFVGKISAAVAQQAELAAKCDAVLRVGGEIREQGNRILIAHEPAVPVDPATIGSAGELPDIDVIWWLSWSVTRALAAVAPGTPHGGIALATLYQDELGRVKLGDFGIVPAFEGICGTEARRQVHCDGVVRAGDSGGGRCSGVWALLGEDEVRENGWSAPYFAHELFEGTLRLSPKSDQFAAGTLLYLLGVGCHPYGASLSDPTLMAYFHLEPFELADERAEWAEIFKRAERGFSTSADQPVLAWSALLRKLLASDPGERYASPAEALTVVAEHCPGAWGEAAAAMVTGLKQLEAGEVEALLDNIAPWRSNESLPALWREPLARWLGGIEERKEEIGAYKRLQQRLAEGQAALNNVEVERARDIAREVLASPRCDDTLRAAAEELADFCDEQEQFIKSGADDLAKAYLESAGECLERRDFDQAREILNGLLKDPATPGARMAQTRRLLAEVELAEQRIEQQQAELAGAGEDLRAGRYDAARQRLEALLKEHGLPEPTSARAQTLLDEVTEAQARRARYVAALEAARKAWERADLETLERHLAEVPPDVSDVRVLDVRRDLASRCQPLRAALDQQAAAKAALEADDAETGLVHAQRVAELGELPQILRDELDELARQCRARVDELERIRIEQVSGFLRAAREACEALEIAECRRRVEKEILPQVGLPEHFAHEAQALLEMCQRVEQARTLLEHARAHLRNGEFAEAAALLGRLKDEGLPAALLEQRDALREEVARAREAHEQRERQRLSKELDGIASRIERGELEEADAALKQVEPSSSLSKELVARAAAARALIREHQPTLHTLRIAERAIEGEAEDLKTVLASLEDLPAELPGWASARVEAVRKRAHEIAERRRHEAIERTTAALGAAEAALNRGDVAAGRGELEKARAGLELDATLAERHRALAALADRLEEWWPKVRAVSELVEQEDFAAAQRQVAALLQVGAIPEICRAALVGLKDRIATGIAQRRAELDAALATLTSDVLERGRRVRKFRQRIETLKADALATPQHRAKADELWAQWERLEAPKRSKTPYLAAASVAVVAVIAAVMYFGGVFGGSGVEPVVTTVAEKPPLAGERDQPVANNAAHEGGGVAGVAGESTKPHLDETPVAQEDVREPATAPSQEPQVAVKPAEETPREPGQPERDIHIESELPQQPELQPESQPQHEPQVEAEPLRESEPPKPTVEEVAADYLAALQRAMSGVAIGQELLPGEAGLWRVEATWNGQSLLPFAALEFDETTGRLAPELADVAEYFRLQVAALESLERTVNLVIPLGDADAGEYRAALRIASPQGATALRAVDRAARRVHVSGVARLEGDPRAESGFAFTADFAGGEFEIDEATRAAFVAYLGALQADRLRDSALALARTLSLPEGVRLAWPEGFAGGGRVQLSVRGVDDRVFGQVDANWDAEALRYEIDPDKAVASMREHMRAVATSETTRQVVADAWSEMRASLARSEAVDADRAAYLAHCELVEVTLRDAELPEPLTAAVEVVVGPPDSDQRIVFPGRLAVRGGRLAWDPRGAEEARTAVAAQCAALTRTLDDKLAELASQPTAELDAFHDVLIEVTAAKIERYGVPGYELAQGLAGAADAAAGLVAVSTSLQHLTAPNLKRDAFAVVFIEYFVGERDVYALSWRAATDDADMISGISGTKVWRVMTAAKLRGYAEPEAFRREYAADAGIGERLLGQAFGDALVPSRGGSFGVMIAPDGPLWLTRWEQVRFEPRRTRGSGPVASLREILRVAPDERRGAADRRAGLWCVPALAGEWHGSAEQVPDLQLGEIVPGKKPGVAHFKQWGTLTFAVITDPTLAGDFGWVQFAADVRREDIGRAFWERRWSGERWNPTPFTSFALLQMP